MVRFLTTISTNRFSPTSFCQGLRCKGRHRTGAQDIPSTFGHRRTCVCQYQVHRAIISFHSERENQGKHTVVNVLYVSQYRKDHKLWVCQLWVYIRGKQEGDKESIIPYIAKGSYERDDSNNTDRRLLKRVNIE